MSLVQLGLPLKPNLVEGLGLILVLSTGLGFLSDDWLGALSLSMGMAAGG